MKKRVLTFGTISGGILAIVMIISFGSGAAVDFETGEILGYLSLLIALSMIFVAVKSFRDNVLDGVISFGKAFQMGLYVTFVASFIYVTTWMILYETSASNFGDEYYQTSIEHIEQSDAPAEEKAAQIQQLEDYKEMYKNPFIRIIFTFIEIFPIGLLISLLSAFLLKRNRQQAEMIGT